MSGLIFLSSNITRATRKSKPGNHRVQNKLTMLTKIFTLQMDIKRIQYTKKYINLEKDSNDNDLSIIFIRRGHVIPGVQDKRGAKLPLA